MFCTPEYDPWNVIETVRISDNPENVTDAAPTEHWLFASVAVEVIDFELDPFSALY
jgi:hypothetical protein